MKCVNCMWVGVVEYRRGQWLASQLMYVQPSAMTTLDHHSYQVDLTALLSGSFWLLSGHHRAFHRPAMLVAATSASAHVSSGRSASGRHAGTEDLGQ
jgi:hypothetical protein